MHYMAKETMSIRIDPDVREALDSVASSVDRDRTWVVNEALHAYLETHRWQIEHIQQGLREAEAGKFASAGAVKKLMNRLRRR
jgi:predicted transcriptional regulator